MRAFHHVLVGLSLDEASANLVLDRACQVAEPDAIEAVHACDHFHHEHVDYPVGAFRTSEELDAAIRNEADEFLTALCEKRGITRYQVLDGKTINALHEYARGIADLVVVGSHGKPGLAAMLGSTSNGLIHGTDCDVLAVHIPRQDPEPMRYELILAAIDLSEASFHVLDQAKALADQCDARLMMCHVSHKSLNQAREKEWDQLAHFADTYGLDDEDVYELEGNTARAINELAEAIEANLVVVGTHGKHGIELVTGSTANAVLHGATCDALSVKIK